MNQTVAIRWSKALLIGAFMIVGGLWVNLSVPSSGLDYDVARYATANRSTVLLAPIFATACTWRSGLLRDYLRTHGRQRTALTAIACTCWPLIVAGLLAQAINLIGFMRGIPHGVVVAEMSAVTLLILLAAGATGLVAGQALPRLVALPVVPMAVWCWLALPAGTGSVLVRNLNGSFAGCCTESQQPSTVLLAASSLVAVAWILGSVLILHHKSEGLARTAQLALVLVIGLLAGSAVVSGSTANLMAVGPRVGEMVCQHRDVTVCVWPEHAEDLQSDIMLVSAAKRRIEAVGVSAPSVYSESSVAPSGASLIDMTSAAPPSERLISMADGLLPALRQTCSVNDRYDPYVAHDSALVWLANMMGVPNSQLRSRFGGQVASKALHIQELPRKNQLRWFNSMRKGVAQACRTGGVNNATLAQGPAR